MSIIHELSRTLPKGNVITGKENTRPFECDGLSCVSAKAACGGVATEY